MGIVEDSQIRFEPGVRANIDPNNPPKPALHALAIWVREVRGGILAGAFYVERNLDVAIEAYFLGPIAGTGNIKSDLFVEGFLRTLNFERRTKIAMLIAEQLTPDSLKEMREGLGELRSIRNAMAHNPCWFEPVVDENDYVRELRPFVQKGKQTVQMSRQLIEEWNDLIRRVISQTEALANRAMDLQS